MTVAEIREVIEQLAAAADRAIRGDLDGVELSVGMDYLFANFLSAQANRREDRYGGETLEARMTFLYEAVDAIRDALGRERLFGIRFYDDHEDYSLRLADYREVATPARSPRQGRLLQHVAGDRAEPAQRTHPLAEPSPRTGRLRVAAAGIEAGCEPARGRDRTHRFAGTGGPLRGRGHRRHGRAWCAR